MSITASQLTGKIVIEGADQAKSTLLGMSDNSKKAQEQLNQLQNAAKDAGSILSNRFTSELKNAQGGLQDLSKRAESAGLDVSKFSSLQQKASEATAKLGMAQAQAASATEKANAITREGSASAEQIALAQARAAVAAENVRKAELAAGDAMTMVTGEATRLADALEMTQSKGGLFSSVMGGMKERASGFFGAISEAPAKLMEATQKIGMFIFAAQQIVQTGEQIAGVFLDLGKKAGDFQQGITQLSTGAGELNTNLGMVSQGLLKLAPEVGESTKELESGMYLIESDGYRGKDALNVLRDAAEGAKVQTADLADVANGVTTALTDYNLKADQSAAVTNDLVATVKSGKTTMGQLASSLKDILPVASTAGISLNGVSAAMATMTGQGVPAGQAANFLRGMVLALIAPSVQGKDTLKEIGLTSQDVASKMRDSLPDALKMITDHLKNKFPEGSAAYMEALKNITGGSESLTAMLDLTGDHMKVFDANVENIYQAVRKGGSGIAGWSEVQKDFNLQMDKAKESVEVFQINLGSRLFPIFSQVFGWISSTAIPALSSFSDWFFDKGVPAIQHFAGTVNEMIAPLRTGVSWLDNFVGHGQAAIPIIAGIGGAITALLLPAIIEFFTVSIPGMATLAAEVVVATWPFLAIGAAVAGLTAIFLHFYNSNAGFHDFINGIGDACKNLWNALLANLMPVMKQVGDFISNTFAPVWGQLQDVWKSQLLPSMQELWGSFQQLQPVLTVVGEIIGGVLLAAIGLLVGAIGGLIGGIAGMAHGLAEAFGGMIQGALGFVQIISGIVAFIVDLFTGHFDKLGGDLKTILGGIGQIFSGFGNMLKGIVDTIVGGVTGAFSGMSTSVLGYLNDLVHGVDDKTQKASIAAQLHTSEMKDKSIANAQKMNEEMQMKLINMRNGIEDQLKQTTDATEKHTLEMKLKAVNNSLEMAQSTGRNIVDMRNKSQEQIDLLKQGIDTSMMSAADRAKYHSLNMKKLYLDGVISMSEETVKQMDKMRADVADQLAHTTDTAEKEALKTKIAQLNHQEETVKEVHNKNVKMRTDTESEMDKLKKSTADKSSSIQKDIQNIFGGIGKWFTDRWHDVQGAFGTTGQWFHDRWGEAWSATTSAFGAMGKWFTDRWHDTQSVFAGIGAWFHDRWAEAWAGVTGFFGAIGKWFTDRWNEVMASTAPFRTYMGAVFQTIWNILVALWGKVSNWFHDRFTEAYNKIVEVFGPIGKWFQNRWQDIVKIFGAIGGWFHDRWVEAYNATTAAFGAIGKWFQDRWQEIAKIFQGIGAWFHDRWTEAWNATTAAFGAIGKWFGDRWTDIQRIFANIGGWFHDRFTEAWSNIVAVFTPIGKWFSDRWAEVMGGINTFKDGVVNKFNEVKTDVSNIFRGMINGIIDQLNNGIGAIESFINFFGKGLDDVAASLHVPGTVPQNVHLNRISHYASGTDSHPGGFMITGEEGPELTWAPPGTKVATHKETKDILAMMGGKIPGYASGVGDLGSQILGWLSGGAKSVLDGMISSLHITAPNLPGMENIASGMFNKVKDWALGWIDKILPKFDFGGVDVPGTVRDWIAQAMALTGTPSSWAGALGTIAMKESGGNPSAINLTDSNAQAGHPSQGLFQTIPSTFAAYALPGHGNILNGIDNSIAGIRYIKSRYGDVFHVPGIMALAAGKPYVGYANGGIISERIEGVGLKTGTRYAFGERGNELVTPYIPSGVNLSSLPVSANSVSHQEVHVHNYIDGREMTDNTANRIIKTSRSSGPIRS